MISDKNINYIKTLLKQLQNFFILKQKQLKQMSLLELTQKLQTALKSDQITLRMRKTQVSFRHEIYGYLNIIDEHTFNSLRRQPTVTPFEFFLKPYGHLKPVQTIGSFSATCKYNDHKSRQKFVITKGSHGNLLSYQTSIDLGINIKMSSSKQRKLSEEMYLEEYKIPAIRPSRVGRKPVSKDATVSSEMRLTQYEELLLRSEFPLNTDGKQEVISVDGQTGLWLNKDEAVNWTGPITLDCYPINKCSDPEVIHKKTNEFIEYTQELTVRYLKPETPINEIIVTQEADYVAEQAPPLVIRQVGSVPEEPEPLVFREVPPDPPKTTGRKMVTISGKRLPPPPRKVVLERLAEMPARPSNVVVERWLPYEAVRRRVVLKRSDQADPVVVNKPRNVIVEWEAPECRVVTRFVDLGVVRADPVEYLKMYKLGGW